MPAAVAAASSSSSSSSASNWLSTWRKSLACRTQANEVHDPRHRQQNPKFQQAAAQDMAPDLLPPATGAALLVNQAASIAASGNGGGSSSMRRFHIGGAGQGHYLRSGCSRVAAGWIYCHRIIITAVTVASVVAWLISAPNPWRAVTLCNPYPARPCSRTMAICANT